MKTVKLLGIALVVLVGVLATTSSASATTLCLKVEDPCSKENIKSKLSIESTDTTFKAEAAVQKCSKHSEESNILEGIFWDTKDLLLLHFTKCAGSCAAATGLPTLELGPTGEGNGVFKGSVSLTQSECALGETCTFSGESEKVMTLLGSATNAKFVMEVKLKLVKGFASLCGAQGVLTGTFFGTTETDKMTSVSKSP